VEAKTISTFVPPPTPESPPSQGVKLDRPKTSLRTPKLSDLANGETKTETITAAAKIIQEDKPYTDDDLLKAWNEFAENRKQHPADYQLLTHPFERRENEVIIYLHNPVQETILGAIKSDLTTYVRERLQNFSITVKGQLVEGETKKILYTNREKFEYLMEKNPVLKEMKERLGLDTDF
jgi:DNA polymerase-3 subunit gamma/tau